MHVLLTNDDGPPDTKVSPYIQFFYEAIKRYTDWKVSIAVPHKQRSWIGKAHMIGEDITASYVYTKGLEKNTIGPFDHPNKELAKDYDEWALLNGTPATCANIGINHLYPDEGPIDLVISGPNFGRNTSAAYILSSGTVGASLEAALCGTKTVALSYSYNMKDHPDEEVLEASKLAVKLIDHLMSNWQQNVQLYSINIPLSPELNDKTVIRYTPLLENQWSSVYEANQKEDNRKHFKWAPKFHLCDATVHEAGPGSDAWTVMNGEISVTPLRACFHSVADALEGVIDLNLAEPNTASSFDAVIDTNDQYVKTAWTQALQKRGVPITGNAGAKTFVYEDYDEADFDARTTSPNLFYSYVFRKGLIRKNYLANTVAYYSAKHPDSILNRAFPESFNLEVDYAEFLDDSLDEAYELRQEIEKNEKTWILKPAMSDRAQGIRIFKTVEGLQAIFDSFEEDSDSEQEEEAADGDDYGIVTSHLRHFVVQEYLMNPLLIDERKFHLRVYVLAVGAVKVYVYQDILALFAGTKYTNPQGDDVDLKGQLTNTCFQGESVDETSVRLFSKLPISQSGKDKVLDEINAVTGDLFAAAVADAINFQPVPNSIEFYGLDFLVDDNYGVRLLEVNAYPDFKQTGEELQPLVSGLFDATIEVAVAPFFGEPATESPLLKQVYERDLKH